MARKEPEESPCFAPFPVQTSSTFDGKEIRSMTYHAGKLFVAVEGRKIWPLEIKRNPNNPLDVSFTCQGGKLIKVDGMEICEMQSLAEYLFFVVRPGDDQPGPLVMMGKDSKIVQVASKVQRFAVNSPPASEKVFVYSEGSKVFEKRLDRSSGTEQWKTIKDFTCDSPVFDVALHYPRLFIACQQGLYVVDLCEVQRSTSLNFQKMSQARSLMGIATLQLPFNSVPRLIATQKEKLYAYSDAEKQAYLLEKNLSCESTPVKFSAPIVDQAVWSTTEEVQEQFCCVGDSIVSVFRFAVPAHGGRRCDTYLRNAKHVVSCRDLFIAASGSQLFALCDIQRSFRTAVMGRVKEALASLPCEKGKERSPMAIVMLFEQLWNADKIVQALELMKLPDFEHALLDVFPLFAFLTLKMEHEKLHEMQCKPITDQGVAKNLAESLAAVRGRHPKDPIKMWVDTALFQIYAMQEDIAKLVALINDIPKLSDESMNEFFDGKGSTPCAMYLNYIGKTKEAMDVFHSLANFDVVVLEEITRVMISNAKDWPFIKDNIVWLLEQSPERACKVLSCEYISVGDAIPFCKKDPSLSVYYPRVLYGTLFRRSLLNRADLVSEYISTVINLLISLREPNFDRKRVAFCSCVIENPDASRELIEEELGTNFIEVMRKFANDIKASTLISFVSKIGVKKVQVEIYRATGKVQEAINLLWGDGDDKGIAACEQFCRENSDPAAAFQVLIRQMESHLPPDKKMTNLRKLLSENMSVIDISSALATIDSDQKLEDIAEFLEKSYRHLVAMRKDAELDAAFAKSNEFESEYQRVRCEYHRIELTSESKCARCGRDVNYKCVQRAPNGMLYHLQCMKDDQ